MKYIKHKEKMEAIGTSECNFYTLETLQVSLPFISRRKGEDSKLNMDQKELI